MVTTITKNVNGKSVPFMFSIRTGHLVSKELGIDSIQELVIKLTEPSFEHFAVIIWKGNENYSFKNNTNPMINNLDEAFDFIDSLSLVDSADLVKAFLGAIKGDGEPAKKK